jgi:hypothetical protein
VFAAANTVRAIGRLNPIEGLALKHFIKVQKLKKLKVMLLDLKILMMHKVG